MKRRDSVFVTHAAPAELKVRLGTRDGDLRC